jgi:signal transduction histidine kinase/DNA-binding response OmpR family regulator
MNNFRNKITVRYAAAAVTVAIVLAFKPVTDHLFSVGPPLLLFLAAVMVTARYAGPGPGLLATAISAVVACCFYVEPVGSLQIHGMNDAFSIVVFMLEGAALSALVGPLHAMERRAVLNHAKEALRVTLAEGEQAEAVARERTANLEAALAAARQVAEKARRVRSAFLATLAHDLRTPLNSILGFTQRLLKKLADSLPERELDALETVDRNAKHLLALISDILAVSTIEAGEVVPNRSRLDLAAVVREAAKQAGPPASTNPVEVRLELPDTPVMLVGDRVMLKQVVVNLLANGIKYTDAGTVTIAVGALVDAQLGRVARIRVHDTGIGIKPEDLGRLFSQFTDLDAEPARKVAGAGFGLAITALYVRMHGGRIDVASEFGHSAEFTVLLPLCAEPHQRVNGSNGVTKTRPEVQQAFPSGNRSRARPGTKGVRILCVEDEPDTLRFLQLTFEDAGYEVLRAVDHDTAIAGAKVARPDLICLDLCLPGKNGYEVLRSLRADPELAGVPVIVVSVTSEEAESVGCGAHRYLSKPVDADELMAAVHSLLSSGIGSALLIEDNPDSSRLLAAMLEEEGLNVRTAANGREGLDRLAEVIPSVIVLDLMMPVMDGFTFLEHVQRDREWAQIPVIILSAKNLTPEEVARLGQASVAILTKGRSDTKQVIDAILRAALPWKHVPEQVTP